MSDKTEFTLRTVSRRSIVCERLVFDRHLTEEESNRIEKWLFAKHQPTPADRSGE